MRQKAKRIRYSTEHIWLIKREILVLYQTIKEHNSMFPIKALQGPALER